MHTNHTIIISDARRMHQLSDASIDLVVTSPPYPMIRMWDGLFSSLSDSVKKALEANDGNTAFEAMHLELDKVWGELYRVLKDGSFACINIGDATRTIGGRFRLYSNHSRIISAFRALGFDTLPVILWRKQTNAPNKFMGSGMLPSGAYVTLEHEYVLVFRKGSKREFTTKHDKLERMESAFFWEERNRWFSDVWDFKGTSQGLDDAELRDRSAAYPMELAYRLINMYSLYGDTVLDPFLGTGTTMRAAIACARSSAGIEIDPAFSTHCIDGGASFLDGANDLLSSRISAHTAFLASRAASNGAVKYVNGPHGFPVMTRQETGMRLYRVKEIAGIDNLSLQARYEPVGALDDAARVEKEKRVLGNAGSGQLALEL